MKLVGADANEASFKEQAPGKRFLHMATHGFFVGGRCPSSPVRSGETLSEAGFDSMSLGGENPLLLTGLALAGANHREEAKEEEEDGILTAEEVAAMDLTGVEWAVLSACDTGVGKYEAGEGLFGLRRAFKVAGARTLITSLWPVEDKATRAWMRALYDARFAKGMGTVQAVRTASLEVLIDRRRQGKSTHPFYWGGFVSSGDWR